MTRRQQITELVKTYLQNISVANGYLTAMGSNVTRWKTNINKSALSMTCNIKDTSNEHQRGHIESLNFEFELSCKAADNYLTITNMIQDLQAALTTNENALGTAITAQVRWLPENETVNIELDGESEIAEATVTMVLEHRITEKWILDRGNY